MLGRCGVFASWTDVFKEILDDVLANTLKQVEGAIQKDKHTLWQAPLSSRQRPHLGDRRLFSDRAIWFGPDHRAQAQEAPQVATACGA